MSSQESKSYSVADYKLQLANQDLARKKKEFDEYVAQNPDIIISLIENYTGGGKEEEKPKTQTQVIMQEVVDARNQVSIPQIKQESLLDYTAMPDRTLVNIKQIDSLVSNNGKTTTPSVPSLSEVELFVIGNDFETQREVFGEPIFVDSINTGKAEIAPKPLIQETIIELPTKVRDGSEDRFVILENGSKFSLELLEKFSFMGKVESEIRSLLPIIIGHLRKGKNATDENLAIADTLEQYKSESQFIRSLIESFGDIDKYDGGNLVRLKRKIAIAWFVDRPEKITSGKGRDFFTALNEYYSNKFNKSEPIFPLSQTVLRIVAYTGCQSLKNDFIAIAQAAIDKYETLATEPEKKA